MEGFAVHELGWGWGLGARRMMQSHQTPKRMCLSLAETEAWDCIHFNHYNCAARSFARLRLNFYDSVVIIAWHALITRTQNPRTPKPKILKVK